MQLSFQSASVAETEAIGRALARVLEPGDVVLLDGPLGAGKTALVRAVAAGLGVDPRDVSSPTFVLVNEYEGLGVRVVHADAYRLPAHDPDALDTLGWDRLVEPGDAVVLVEWGQRIAPLTRFDAAIRITPEGGTATYAGAEPGGQVEPEERVEAGSARRIELRAPDQWADRAAMAMLRSLAPPAPVLELRRDTTCPITGRPVPADSPTWPFADERARLADLYRWLSE